MYSLAAALRFSSMYKLPEIRGSPTETLAHSLSGAGAGVHAKRACGVMRRTHRHCAMHGAHGWRKTGRNKGNTMDTRWLQDFVTLSEVRNFTRAAELRNLSQAAFSRRIQSLEQWLGARLIDRNAYPTQLTDAGERFRAIAIELINQLAEARADIGGAPGRNQIRLAAPYALATTRLPGWWRQWDAEQACSARC